MIAKAISQTNVPSVAPLRVVLAGHPNCGKTSIFNALTGAWQRVGNYPGVTVERRAGRCVVGETAAEIIDLPGTYSLSAYSPEERVAELELGRSPDVVVVVADSTQLKRHLVLLAQIMHLGANLVLCLNMADEAHALGRRIDVAAMERLLGFPVVETVGHRREGMDALRGAIARASSQPKNRPKCVLGDRLTQSIAQVAAKLPALPDASSSPACRSNEAVFSLEWTALRLILGSGGSADTRSETRAPGSRLGVVGCIGNASTISGVGAISDVDVGVHATTPETVAVDALLEAERQRHALEGDAGQDIATYVSGCYFGFVDGLLRQVETRTTTATEARRWTDHIDAIVVHPVLGLPLFGAVMFAIFWLTFTIGEYPMGWIESGTGALVSLLSTLWPEGEPSMLRSLILDGLIGGVGGVVVFLPNIVLLFLGLSVLEDTGYMARAAFLTDRVMHRFGLHGKSFIPMVTGFGCSIPAIMATRTLESERDRLATMLVLPLMSCGARLPIWMLLVPAFCAPRWRAPALWFLYAFGIALALALAWTLRKTLLRGRDAPFVMELPPYRCPTLRSLLLRSTHRSALYLQKAGTTILALSIVLWAATTFPRPDRYEIDQEVAAGRAVAPEELSALRSSEDLAYSIAGRIGHSLEPVFAPIGFDWKIVTAMIGAFAAKEVFVAQMGIVYSIVENGGDAAPLGDGGLALAMRLSKDYTPVQGISFILFLLIATPCLATVVVTKRESGRWRWALFQFFGLTSIAYIVSLVFYQAGRLLS
ncbi:MAG: ferrous iron transport protein B [Deltaproteobacteria bacterium]|nr:ferrous iron transport protein B [Deltaproteobacteria bacterium]